MYCHISHKPNGKLLYCKWETLIEKENIIIPYGYYYQLEFPHKLHTSNCLILSGKAVYPQKAREEKYSNQYDVQRSIHKYGETTSNELL